MALKIGITGGIGSGKTTVCKIFETLGIPVYYSDERAKALMVEDENVIRAVKTLFGNEAYFSDGKLNRKHIAGIVFSDNNKLEALNSIVHPAIFEDADKWHATQTNVPYTIREAALLVETGSYLFLNKLIVVTAPEELRIQRVMARDGVGTEQVRARISKQMPDEVKIGKADFIVSNDGQNLLIPQVIDIHKSLFDLTNKERK